MKVDELKLIPKELAPAEVAFWRGIALVALLSWSWLVIQVGIEGAGRGLFGSSLKWRVIGAASIGLALALLVVTILTWTRGFDWLARFSSLVYGLLTRLRWLNLLPALACAVLFSFLIYGFYGYLLLNIWVRVGLLLALGQAGGFFLRAAFTTISWSQAFLAGLLGVMLVYQSASFLPALSSSPISLGWSEASRFYYASLFFSKSIYGVSLPLPFLHPSRYLLQSLPFLIPDLPILAHRLWQVILWLGMTGLTSWLLVRRLKPEMRVAGWLVGVWGFLFLFQGPVYYHLLVPVALILWGFQPRRFWRSLAVLLAASIWAGISRINWFPVPAMLGLAIYFLEVPQVEAKNLLRYLIRPALWTALGTGSAYITYQIYIRLSGVDPALFSSSLSSNLLWYRLWPSPTYPPGILPMTAIVSLPMVGVIAIHLTRRRFSIVRLLALVGMILVLLVGGLVVSTKIGGGSNLHNMDAYLVLLLVCGTWMAFNRDVPEALPSAPPVRLHWAWVLLIALLPVYPLLRDGLPFAKPNLQISWDDTNELRQTVQNVVSHGGKVLFIWQRQLVTFHLVGNVELEPRYETVDLMEMAMGNNQPYLDQFYTNLKDHRYALIVSSVQNVNYQGSDYSFPEENNVWVERVSTTLLQYYQSSKILPYSGTQLLVPKK